jgi:D-alanine-D-alanine ligase-like ATP-grasp enzyme
VLVKFGAKYKSGEVVPEKGAFTEFAWVNVSEVKEYDCIQGVDKEVEETIKQFS